MATPTAINNKWPPPLRAVEELTQLLKPENGQRLDELKLCWYEPVNKNDGKGLLTKRNIAALKKSLKKTRSRITSLSIGWKHGGNRKYLVQLLQLFTGTSDSLPVIHPLTSLELVLDAWIPEPVLLQLLLPQAPYLKKLHIQATRMKVRTKKQITFRNAYQSAHCTDQYVLSEESVAQLLLEPQLNKHLTNLESLALIDCDVLDEDVDVLFRFLWHRPNPVKDFSLRSNRHMSPESLKKICQAPVTDKLDLSLCDITNLGAFAIERAFAHDNRMGWRQRHNRTLKELTMCGNYQLDHIGFVALCRCVPSHVEHWNLSYCDMTEYETEIILEELARNMVQNDTPLKELVLHGAKVANDEACQALGKLLRGNRTLISVQVDDPTYPMQMRCEHLKFVVDGLEHNYQLQEFAFDKFYLKWPLPGSKEEVQEKKVRNGLEFYILLNQAGRGMLQSNEQVRKKDWIKVLEKARMMRRLDILYWLLRNSLHILDWGSAPKASDG